MLWESSEEKDLKIGVYVSSLLWKEIPQACVGVVEGVLTPEKISKWFQKHVVQQDTGFKLTNCGGEIFLEREIRLKWRNRNNEICLKKIYIYIYIFR